MKAFGFVWFRLVICLVNKSLFFKGFSQKPNEPNGKKDKELFVVINIGGYVMFVWSVWSGLCGNVDFTRVCGFLDTKRNQTDSKRF